MFYKETNFRSTNIGEVPSAWEVVNLGDAILEIADGGTPSTKFKEYFNGDIPWVNIEDIKKDILDTRRKLSKFGLEHSSAKLWNKGTIIFSFGASIGKVGIARVPLATKQGIAGIVPNPARLVNEFLYYVLERSSERVRNISKGMGSTIREVRPPKLRNLIIFPLPTLYEQQKIAEVLSGVDSAIQKADEVIAKTERLKKGLLQKLLTEGIGHKEFKDTEIGKIPKEWEVVKLEDTCSFVGGGTPSKSNPEYWQGSIPWVSPEDMVNSEIWDSIEHITEKGLRESSTNLVDANSILVVFRSGILKRKIPIAVSKVPVAINQDLKAIVPNSKLVPEFLANYLRAIEPKILRLVKTGSTVQSLTPDRFFKLGIPIPSLTEQQRIVEIIVAAAKKIDLEMEERKSLERVKTGLMNLLLSGRVRVKVD